MKQPLEYSPEIQFLAESILESLPFKNETRLTCRRRWWWWKDKARLGKCPYQAKHIKRQGGVAVPLLNFTTPNTQVWMFDVVTVTLGTWFIPLQLDFMMLLLRHEWSWIESEEIRKTGFVNFVSWGCADRMTSAKTLCEVQDPGETDKSWRVLRILPSRLLE